MLDRVSKEFQIERTADITLILGLFIKQYTSMYYLLLSNESEGYSNDNATKEEYNKLMDKCSFQYPETFLGKYLSILRDKGIASNENMFEFISHMFGLPNGIIKSHIKNIINDILDEVGIVVTNGYDPLEIFNK